MVNKSADSENWKLKIGLVLLLGLLLRVPGLFSGISFHYQYALPLHPDEPKIFSGAIGFPEEIFTRTDLRYPTGLHYLIGLLTLPLKSLNKLDVISNLAYKQSVFLTGRLVSIGFGVGAIFLVFLIANKMYGRKAGLIAALILAVCFYHANHSSVATTDVVNSFWVALTALLIYRISNPLKKEQAILLGASLGFTAGTKYSGAVIAVSLLFALALMFLELTKSAQRKLFIKNIGLLSLVAIFTFFLTTPSALLNINTLISSLSFESNRLALSNSMSLGQILAADFDRLIEATGLPVAILIIAGITYAFKPTELRRTYPLVITIIAYIVFLGSGFITRYYISIMPILCILAAIPVANLFKNENRLIQKAAIAMFVIVFLYSVYYNLLGIEVRLNDTRMQATAYLQDHLASGTTVGNLAFGNVIRSSWTLPIVNDEIFEVVPNLDYPEYIVLSSIYFRGYDQLLDSGLVPPDYVINQALADQFNLPILPNPQTLQLYDQLLNNAKDNKYVLLKIFPQNILAPVEFPPPEIRIYKRVNP